MVTEPSTPGEVPCEWCGDPSVKAIQHTKRAGQFVYACARHIETAEASVTNTKRST